MNIVMIVMVVLATLGPLTTPSAKLYSSIAECEADASRVYANILMSAGADPTDVVIGAYKCVPISIDTEPKKSI